MFRIYKSLSEDIFTNLALENYLFLTLRPHIQGLFLWSNSATVVIGRYQNPFLECSVSRLREDHIPIARRQSGGGTVWHDRGNLCVTFFGSRSTFSRPGNTKIVVGALQSLGIPAEMNDRSDILVEGKKVSGSAFRETADYSFHHCTLLLHADLARLGEYLRPAFTLPEAKGVKSKPSAVTNLRAHRSQLSMDQLEETIVQAFVRTYGGTSSDKPLLLGSETVDQLEDIRAYRDEISQDSWVFGMCPPFTREVSFDGTTIRLTVEGGIVTNLELGETAPPLVRKTASALTGLAYVDLATGGRQIVEKYENQGFTEGASVLKALIQSL